MAGVGGRQADDFRRRRRQLFHRGDAARRARHHAVLQPAGRLSSRPGTASRPATRRARAQCSTPRSWRSTGSARRAATSSTTSTSSCWSGSASSAPRIVRSPTMAVDPITQREIDELLEQLVPAASRRRLDMDPFAPRQLGRTERRCCRGSALAARRSATLQRRQRADAEATLAGGLGRRRALLRYLALVRARPQRAPHRRRALRTSRATRSIALDQGRPHLHRARRSGGVRSERAQLAATGSSSSTTYDYSYDGVMRSYEDSLQRLGMNRIDLLIIHDLDLAQFRTDELVTRTSDQLATRRHAGARGAARRTG